MKNTKEMITEKLIAERENEIAAHKINIENSQEMIKVLENTINKLKQSLKK